MFRLNLVELRNTLLKKNMAQLCVCARQTKKISLVEILSQTPRQTMPVFFTSYITANTALYAFRFLA